MPGDPLSLRLKESRFLGSRTKNRFGTAGLSRNVLMRLSKDEREAANPSPGASRHPLPLRGARDLKSLPLAQAQRPVVGGNAQFRPASVDVADESPFARRLRHRCRKVGVDIHVVPTGVDMESRARGQADLDSAIVRLERAAPGEISVRDAHIAV